MEIGGNLYQFIKRLESGAAGLHELLRMQNKRNGKTPPENLQH